MNEAEAIRTRADAIGHAMQRRALSVRDAEVEYSEAVGKLRERFEADMAEALRRYRHAVTPAHRAYNGALIRAEQDYAGAV